MARNAERAPGKSANQQQRPNCADTLEPTAAVVNVIVLTPTQLQGMLDAAATMAVESVSSTPKSDIADMSRLCREYDVSAPTVRKWIAAGMPCMQCGEVRRFNLRLVEQWLSERAKAGAA